MGCACGIACLKKENAMLSAAQQYGKRGWRIFPLLVIRPDGSCECSDKTCDKPGKHPAVNWGSEATDDPRQIEEWWGKRPDRGIGIATGEKSGITVLDIDGPEGVMELG